jgi:hypothetical protein
LFSGNTSNRLEYKNSESDDNKTSTYSNDLDSNSQKTISLTRSGKTKSYSDKYYNFSFSIPEEYNLVPSEFDDKCVFAENDDYPKIVVYHNDFKSMEDIFASGVTKEVVFKSEYEHLIYKFKGEDGITYLCSVGYGQKGGTTIYMMDKVRDEHQSISELIQIRKSIKQGKFDQELHADYFRKIIANKTLTFLFTGNGYSEKKILNICGNGIFYRNSSMGGFSTTYNSESTDHYSLQSNSKGDGTWTIFTVGNHVTLRLNQNDDTYIEHKMYLKDNFLYLSGERYFRTELECKL